MKRASIRIAIVVMACAGLAACAETDDGLEGPDAELRSANTDDFWNLRPNNPGNGPVQLNDEGGMTPPDIIIWDIDGDGEGSDVFDPAGSIVLSTVENQVLDGDGNVQCTAWYEDGLYKLREGLDGAVVYTATRGRYVFAGDVQSLPQSGTSAWQDLVYSQLEYEFYGKSIYDGPRWQGDLAGTSSEKLHRASPMRKLLIASLYGGACGSPGVPETTPPGPQN